MTDGSKGRDDLPFRPQGLVRSQQSVGEPGLEAKIRARSYPTTGSSPKPPSPGSLPRCLQATPGAPPFLPGCLSVCLPPRLFSFLPLPQSLPPTHFFFFFFFSWFISKPRYCFSLPLSPIFGPPIRRPDLVQPHPERWGRSLGLDIPTQQMGLS